MDGVEDYLPWKLWQYAIDSTFICPSARANFHDKFGRTVLIMRPGKEIAKNFESQDKFLVYNLENAIFNLPEGQGQRICYVYRSNLPETFYIYCKTTILRDWLWDFSFLYNPPWVFEIFFKMVKYFIDPITFEKIKFVYSKHGESADIMKTYFDEENLPTEFGGKATLSFDYEEFSQIMAQDDLKRDAYWGLKTDLVNDQSQARAAAGHLSILTRILHKPWAPSTAM